MPSARTIAVLGATGGQGGAVARHLLADGWQVRALTRDPDSSASRRLAELGASVMRADMMQPETLAAPFDGAVAVFSVQNPMISGLHNEVVQGKNVADAAQRAGVQHLVYGAAGVGDEPTGVGSWDSKLAVQRYMDGLGLPVTVLRPVAFMELMTDKRFYPPVSTWHLMPKLMGSDRPVWWIALDDLGAIAARVFADPARFVGKSLPLAADIKSIDECRELWREVVGRRPRGVPMPSWMFQRFVGDDLPTMWRWLRTGPVEADVDATRAILPEAVGVRQWLERLAT